MVTGQQGDWFYVEAEQKSRDETFETIWKLSCTTTDDRRDRLHLTITEWSDIRFSQDQCGSGFDDPPKDGGRS